MKTKRGNKGETRRVRYSDILSSGSASFADDNHPTSFICDNSSWTILTSPGDGHCILHSVVSSFRQQLPHLPGISMDYVVTALSNETISNSEYYLPFTEDLSIIALRRGLRLYIMDKEFDQSFCDLVPMILANALKLSITVLNQSTDGLFSLVTFSPTPAHCSSLFLHRIDRTTLDLILINRPSTIIEVRSGPGMSDHNIVLAKCYLNTSRIYRPQRTILKLNQTNWDEVREVAADITTAYLERNPDSFSVQENGTFIETRFQALIDKHIPSKLSKTRPMDHTNH